MTKVYTVKAFSKDRQGGNAAGVVLQAEGLSREEKQQIAQRMGFSETAFVSPSPCADYRLEYFTPVDEVALCGHATIGTFVLMHQLGVIPSGTYTIQTLAGVLKVKVADDGTVMMQQTLPQFMEVFPAEDFSACLQSQWTNPQLSIQAVSTGLKDIIFPIDTPEHLFLLHPNFPAMASLNQHQQVVGIHAFALTPGEATTAVCRNFAPLYGIDEESATGTSNCALACYLFRYLQQQDTYLFEQGHNLGDVSQILVRILHQEGTIQEVYVGGKGYIV